MRVFVLWARTCAGYVFFFPAIILLIIAAIIAGDPMQEIIDRMFDAGAST